MLIKYLNNKGAHFRKIKNIVLHKLIFQLTNIMYFRFILFYDYLQSHQYDNVLITDIRDVFFQCDPFDYGYKDCLYSFAEYRNISIQSNKANLKWIKAAYPSSFITSELLSKPVICAGVTIGNYKRIILYLEAMTNEIIRVAPHIGAYMGPDQGIHNYLIWNKKIKNVIILNNNNGPVLTIGVEPDENIRVDKNGKLVNNDNSIINILHQYDRNKRILKHLKKMNFEDT